MCLIFEHREVGELQVAVIGLDLECACRVAFIFNLIWHYAMQEALKWVTNQPAWNRSEGRDHILPVHHPWSFKSVRRYMKNAIWLLPDMDSTGNWSKLT